MPAFPCLLRRLAGALCLVFLATPAFAQVDDARTEAARLLREVLEARQAAFGKDHPQALDTEKQLAELLVQVGRTDEALPMLRHIARATEQQFGERHPETLAAKEALAKALIAGSAPVEGVPSPRAGRPAKKMTAVETGLDWLARHQDSDGKWDSDGFEEMCEGAACPDAGEPVNDVGLTGLSMLAFLGAGGSLTDGPHKQTLRRATLFLREVQNPETGLFGPQTGQSFMYNHALASLAMVEAYRLSKNPMLEQPAQLAVNFILRARNPYKAWRYDSPPNGENDTAVTGWMVLVLTSAESAGLQIDKSALEGALSWLDEMTDGETGRTGYVSRGSRSAREAGTVESFPPDKTEALTAEALLARLFLGQGTDHPIVQKGAALLRQTPPVWRPETGEVDMYYWFFGSQVAFRLGGSQWEEWSRAIQDAALSHQQDGDTCLRGSWDPVGPWGKMGGRVYSTALMVLTSEVHARYAHILSAR